MNPILVLVRKDFAILLKDKVSISVTFLVPFVLIYLFGQVFHVNSSSPGPSGIPLGVVNLSDNAGAAKIVGALEAEKAFKVITTFENPDKSVRPLVEDDLRPLMKGDAFRFALVIPKDLIPAGAVGLRLRVYSNPRNDIETQMVNGILQKTLFMNAPRMMFQSLQARERAYVGGPRLRQFNASIASAVAATFGGDPSVIGKRMDDGDIGAFAGGAGTPGGGAPLPDVQSLLSRLVKIDTIQVAGGDVKSPMATQLVGGWAMQFLLFAVTASATALFWEKQGGIFQRVLSAPVTRADILWSKFIYGTCLGLIQLMVLFAAGHILYGIEIGSQLGHLALLCVFAAAACASFGMLIAALSPTPEAARGISTFVILLMCAVGGAWFPVSFMPDFIQRFSKLTLVYWAMEGFSQVLWAHASLADLLPTLGWLSLITGVVMAVSVWRFSKGRIFE